MTNNKLLNWMCNVSPSTNYVKTNRTTWNAQKLIACRWWITLFLAGNAVFVESFLDQIVIPPESFHLSKREAQRKSLTKGNICYQVYRSDIWWSVFTTFYLCGIVKRSFLIIEFQSSNLHTHGKPSVSCKVNPDISLLLHCGRWKLPFVPFAFC